MAQLELTPRPPGSGGWIEQLVIAPPEFWAVTSVSEVPSVALTCAGEKLMDGAISGTEI
jgi:hypothetical protein